MKSRNFLKPDRNIIIIAHNIRSTSNVGSILRTADCLGAQSVIATGYTANLDTSTDGSNLPLLPHLKQRLLNQLHRSALGAESIVNFHHHNDINDLIDKLKDQGYRVVGLEQTSQSISLSDYQPSSRIALLLGEEVHGISQDLINQCDDLIEIPMFGNKESYNVSVAAGIALYHLAITG